MSLWAEVHTYGEETPIVRNDIPIVRNDNPFTPNNMGSDFYSNWYFDTQPEPYDFQEPYEQEPEPYDLQPRMLDNEYDFIGFSTETNTYIKKYNITPLIFCEEAEELEEVEECSICYEQMKRINAVTLNCNHRFCGGCIKQTLECHNDLINNPSCALCRTIMTSFSVKNPDTYNEISLYCR
jgi:hypothetical protein